jgi:nucleoside-diphosphate-sugar epimerase
MKNILVVGAIGYVASELVSQLLRSGKNVTGLDRVEPVEKIPFIKSDITGYMDLSDSLKGKKFDTIIHMASLPGDTGNPLEMVSVNVNGLLNMLEYARLSKVDRFVLASSISAYEWYPATKFCPPDYMPVDENHPCRPRDMYSTTKYMQELLSMTYYHQYGLPVSILRLTAVVGPAGKGGGRSWYEFAKSLSEGKKVQIPHFSTEELCHYVDIRDVARMFIAVAEKPGAVGEIFNCVGPEPVMGQEFADIVNKLYPEVKVDCGFPWSMAQGGEISFSMEKAKKLLDFEPIYSLEDTIKSIKEWIEQGGLEKFSANNMNKYGDGVKK